MDFMFEILRSILPRPNQKKMVVPTAPSSQIISTPSSNGGSKDASALDIKGTEENAIDERMESIDSTDGQPLNLPAVRIEQPGGSDQLLIRIITLKRSTHLTSKLFEVLEEENLDVFHVNRFCVQEKILHTIQVKVLMPSKLDTDGLRRKLCSWAAAKRAE